MEKITSVVNLNQVIERIRAAHKSDQPRVTICCGTGCQANGSVELTDALARELGSRGLNLKVEIKRSGCHGLCQKGPVTVVDPQGIFYQEVGLQDVEADVRDIIEQTILQNQPVDRLLYKDPATKQRIPKYNEIPFYAKQMRIALQNNGKVDPKNIEDYFEVGGYTALAKVLSLDPEYVIEQMKKSGLRGRGGGGFPTGQKWAICRAAQDRSLRNVICNADEGDPGAFMDRSIMEGDPHSVLEGMVIGAYAMSFGLCPAQGYIYIRAEYPLAVENVRAAIEQAEAAGMLGDNILGGDFTFHIKVKEGAGAFVCGEETALMASIEGERGMPRPRPPFPAVKGLFGKPTNINNVETWANVPKIINNGADWYAAIGTPKSTGTKVFSLVGKVQNCGLVEVPMGITLREVIFEIGGGIVGGKKFKAAQTGGPSGGCIPEQFLDLPIDYDNLAQVGSIMGSGGLVVMDEDNCMVDIARYFLSFTQSESCGKCTPCRLGTKAMLDILTRITEGKGVPEDLETIVELGAAIKNGSLCGLGQTAPNPALTTLKYFRHEYEEHILDKKCRAAVCRELVGAPCRHTCPAGVDAARYVRLLQADRPDLALQVIYERLPLPSVCGLVCFHPCETRCRRRLLDEAVSVRALKRYAAEQGGTVDLRVGAAARTGKRVAVIGAGPAGLAAAYYLSKKGGHDVTIFEAMPKPGGMLRYGIPDFRLTQEALDREIAALLAPGGIEFKLGTRVESVPMLLGQGFSAVFISIGAHEGLKLGAFGEDGPGVEDCIAFLRRVKMGQKIKLGDRVAVVGGGNAAVDAARVALRMGAGDVHILYRRTRAEMPAFPEEIRDAEEEGVKIDFLTVPLKIERKGGRLHLTCLRFQLGPMDDSGRPRPVPIPVSDYLEIYDYLIPAIGQRPTSTELGVELEKGQFIKVKPRSLETSVPGIFAGGDAVTGPASVIEAIQHGRLAAANIDRFLGGAGDIREVFADPDFDDFPLIPEAAADWSRTPMKNLSPKQRSRNFRQIEKGYTRDQVLREACRCLRCDLELEAERKAVKG